MPVCDHRILEVHCPRQSSGSFGGLQQQNVLQSFDSIRGQSSLVKDQGRMEMKQMCWNVMQLTSTKAVVKAVSKALHLLNSLAEKF